ncbi:AAA family ATPase [Nocardioides sp. NPDC058538]|uniref:AAA family ATPase n=1 Tax=Nocardioides sp. NPDC058538 TaxID=3346542 RepID=UPI00366980CB
MSGLPTRIAVAGVSGSGKSTLAKRISEHLDIPYMELDALHHGPAWTPRPEFVDDVRALVARPAWVSELQYAAAKPLILERVEVIVWLDVPTPLTMYQVIRRTLVRRVRRTELWNGNVEPPLRSIFTDREHVVLWAWKTRNRLRVELPDQVAAHPGVRLIRVRSHRAARRWLASMTEASPVA